LTENENKIKFFPTLILKTLWRKKSLMWEDFKAFIARGNILDLAIAVMMGAAFGSVVKTFTDGIIMPVVGLITGGIDFKAQAFNLTTKSFLNAPAEFAAAQANKEPLIMYGQFINDIINFLIVATVMFFLARYALKLFKSFEAAPTPPTGEEVLLTEIRDILKNKPDAV
jgi:large conductance mechanosensitive channel